jgi:hypothetical protein
MAVRHMIVAAAVALVAATAGAAGCAPLGALDEVVSPSRNTVVTGEVRTVDGRRGRLQVRDDRSSRTHTVRYDNRTRVVYQSRQYPVSALERGDLVQMRVSYDRGGEAWADRIEVRRSVRDTRAASSRVQRMEGRVGQVDTRRGYFTLEQGLLSRTVVYVPRRISSSDARRFDRLRRGERVRADVRVLGRGEVELVRFR